MHTTPIVRKSLSGLLLLSSLGLLPTAPALAQTYIYTEATASARHTEINVAIDGAAGASTTPRWNGMFQQNRADGFSDWQSWVRVIQGANGPNLVELRGRQDCSARTSFGTPPGCVRSGPTGMQTISFPMVNNGGLLQLDMRGWASAGTSVNLSIGQVSADSWSDLGHTIAWGGITEVRDANNQLVSNFSAISASSGFDYRNAYVSAVPELPAPALAVLGLGLMGLVSLRRRRTGPAACV